MNKTILNIKETPEFYDSTDALAVAICHCLRSETPKDRSNSWAEYIKNNPDRIVKL